MYLFKSQDEMESLRDTRWVDGLRGIASIFVVASHIVVCVARNLTNPCCGEDGQTPTLFQLPFLRLVSTGHSWVAIFFLLSGFVNSLKPIKAMRTGRVDAALSNLATSSFRRSFRLVLPAAAATVISWLLCNLRFYEIATHSDAYWFYAYTEKPSASWGQAFVALFYALRNTWSFDSENPYEQPQWLLKWLLEGSMIVFMSLLITVHMSPKWRIITVLLLTGWSFQWTFHQWDPSLGQSILPGVVLAEFSMSPKISQLRAYSWILTPVLLFIGGFMMSFPSNSQDAAPWSRFMLSIGKGYLPETHDPPRVWGAFGAITSILAIMISVPIRRVLSSRLCLWLGKISYSIYLLHGIFLRTIFAWIMFMGEDVVQIHDKDNKGNAIIVERYPLPGAMRIAFGIFVSMSMLLVACEYWHSYMEPVFGKITKRAEELTAAEPFSPGKLESYEYP